MYKNVFTKLAIIVLGLIAVFGLTACNSSGKVPYGSINNDTYLTIGDYSMTKKELYNELRMEGSTIIKDMIEKGIFDTQIQIIEDSLKSTAPDDTQKEYVDTLDKDALNAVLGTLDEKSINKLPAANKRVSIEKFVDNLYVLDPVIFNNSTLLINDLTTLLTGVVIDEDSDNTYPDFSNEIRRNYMLPLAKKIFAKVYLLDDVIDEDDDNYIKDEAYVTNYKSNVRDQYDLNAFVINFNNANEYETILKKLGYKAMSGTWYSIPTRDQINLDITAGTVPADVQKILDDYSLIETSAVSYANYKKFYEYYKGVGSPQTALTDVLQMYISIANAVNKTTLTPLDFPAPGTFDATNTLSYYEYDQDDHFLSLNSGIRTYVYGLKLQTTESPSNKPYSTSIQTNGSKNYIAFKLADNSTELKYSLLNKDGNEFLTADDSDDFPDGATWEQIEAEIKKFKDDVITDLIDAKLTDSYVTAKIDKLYKDGKLNIYDAVIRSFYKHANASYNGGSGYKNKNTLANFKVKSKDLKVDINFTLLVDDFYKEIEKRYGASKALDVLSTKILEKAYSEKITKDDQKTFKTNLKDMLTQFSNNGYESSGFPASIGRKNFLLLSAKATSNEQAIRNLYFLPKVKELFYKDYDAHFNNETKSIYQKFAELAQKQYDEYKSLTTSHFLIFTDFNNDGNPDDPTGTDIDQIKLAAALAKLPDLAKKILDRLTTYSDKTAGLEAIAKEFETAGRVLLSLPTDPSYKDDDNLKATETWGEFRELGFEVKYESLSEITNISNFLSNSGTLDKNFYNRALYVQDKLYNEILGAGIIEDDKTSYSRIYLDYFDSRNTLTYGTTAPGDEDTNLKHAETAFGWHLILGSAIKTQTSAKDELPTTISESSSRASEIEATSKDVNTYEHDGKHFIHGYNNTTKLTQEQIHIYITESGSDYGVESLSSSVQSAISSFFSPIKTMYESNDMKSIILVNYLNIDETHDKLGNYIKIYKRQLFGYISTDPTAPHYDSQYATLYGDWFTILQS